MKQISFPRSYLNDNELARIEAALRGTDTPPVPKQVEPLTLAQVRADVIAHQKSISAAKTGPERSVALSAANKFIAEVMRFAERSENLNEAADLAFSLNPLTVAADHAEQFAEL